MRLTTLLLAHPARVEPATLSTANCASWINGQAAANNNNNISKMISLDYCRIFPNMA